MTEQLNSQRHQVTSHQLILARAGELTTRRSVLRSGGVFLLDARPSGDG